MSSDNQGQAKRRHERGEGLLVTVTDPADPEDTYTYRRITANLDGRHIVSTILEKYAKIQALFEKTDYYKKAVAFFQNDLLPRQSQPIDRIVCFGLGPLSVPRSTSEDNPYYQLAFIEVILKLLRSQYTIKDQDVYFQDPSFAPSDYEFMRLKNFTVVDDPYGYNILTPTTLIHAAVDWEVIFFGLEAQPPAVWIGENLKKFTPKFDRMGCIEHIKANLQVIERIPKHYTLQDMPEFINDVKTFVASAIYWNPDEQMLSSFLKK